MTNGTVRNDRASPPAIEQALALHRSGRLDDAAAQYRSILQREPRHFHALHLFGLLRHQQGRHAEAIELIGGALALAPENPDALMNYGAALAALSRHDEALASFDKVLALNPRDAEALFNRGSALLRLRRFSEAAASYDQFLALNPRDPEALNSRGMALRELRRYSAALSSFDTAITLKPDYAQAYLNKANTLVDLNRLAEAVASYDSAIAADPRYADALASRGSVLAELRRHREAIASFQQAIKLAPDHPYAFAGLATSALAICDWAQTAKYAVELPARVRARNCEIRPLRLLEYADDPALHLACARNHFHAQMPEPAPPLWDGKPFRHDRIRLAYLSADYYAHATANLVAGLFEHHDHTRFECYGISYGPHDASAVRSRLVAAFDHFHQVASKSDHEVAQLLRQLEIDIAVDLKGYTSGERPGILAYRPCPIQVSYLGYPGTLGVDFIDYVIADRFVLPFDQQPFFTEKIVHLPDSYQVNDSRREIAGATPSREDAGLPASGFVFCCFNNAYKITAQMFDVWMRLLQRVDGSVLWLLKDDAAAQENLCKEAAARGVDPARLVFAARTGLPQHLARHRLADLFLDTLPYNAHTTASDALWAGLPVLTCRGRAFAGRVASSLNHAAGLDGLVTVCLEDYEAVALRLASDVPLLRQYRDTLVRSRLTCPLFDTARFCRHIEAAYVQMWQRWQRGEPPRAFAVEPLSA